jgi:hypothetical protein
VRALAWFCVLSACSPHPFHELVDPLEDAGAQPDAALVEDARTPPLDAAIDATADATIDAQPRAPDAQHTGGQDAMAPRDAAALDAATFKLDGCGQRLPQTPAQSAIESVAEGGTIAQSARVLPRAPTDLARLGGRNWWLFPSAFLPSLRLQATDSISGSTPQQPYALDEVGKLPTSFLPALDADRTALRDGEQLTYQPGSLLATTGNDALAFYGPMASSSAMGAFLARSLGTRVAKVHVDGDKASATPVSELLFSPGLPQFRFGLIDGGYVYLYGCSSDAFSDAYCKLARARRNDATRGASYQFRASGGWSNDFSAAVDVLGDARAELSISHNAYLNSYLAVHFAGLTSTVWLQTAPRPEGPWQKLDEIALDPPDGTQDAHSRAIEHPELAEQCGRKLVVTYLHAAAAGNELRRLEVTLRQP